MSAPDRSSRPPIGRVAVIIPARDEEDLLGACLAAVVVAAGAVTASLAVPVQVIVVLDRCVDRTAAVVAAWRSVPVATVRSVATDVGMVGAARALGAATALHRTGSGGEQESGVELSDPGGTWLAHTDADSLVPPDWLVHQLELAATGADLVLGTVRLPPGRTDEVTRAWQRAYARRCAVTGVHPHVHGANIGVRGSTYLSAGGFPAVAAHEDLRLVLAVGLLGHAAVVRTSGASVVTSDRRWGRAPTGVAGDLRAMSRALTAAAGSAGAPVRVPGADVALPAGHRGGAPLRVAGPHVWQ